jgi:predicted MFS family arabinose efflux permease
MSLVFSIKQTGVPLGGLMAGALVPTLALTTGWRGSLWVVAVVSLLCAGLAQSLRQSLDAERNPFRVLALGNLAQPLKLIARHPALKRLAAYSFVFSIAQLCLTTYFGDFFVPGDRAIVGGCGLGVVGRAGGGHCRARGLGLAV